MPARGAVTLFHVRGIRIGIDYSWFFVLFLVIFVLSDSYRSVLDRPDGDALPYVLAVASALAFFASILLHELGHAFVALRRGIGISDITLWMFGGVARMTKDSDSPRTEFEVAVAGPLVTLALAIVFTSAGVVGGFAYLFIALGIVAFFSGNLIDGIWLALIGFILLQSARGAVIQTEFTSRIEGLRVADVMDDEPVAIPENASVERALDEFFLRYRWPWFPVVDPAQRFLGLIERGAADAVPETVRTSSTVRDVFEADSTGTLRVRDDAPLESLLGNDALGRLGALMAVDEAGHLRGVITAEQVGRALRRALSGGEAPPRRDPPGV